MAVEEERCAFGDTLRKSYMPKKMSTFYTSLTTLTKGVFLQTFFCVYS